mmetsp:Transcript_7560/g.24913  ORF Transcript_7560/g.24913 Transcript_7560/m.24913 type:complete len:164 (-) Transcript_7560:64-555(-)
MPPIWGGSFFFFALVFVGGARAFHSPMRKVRGGSTTALQYEPGPVEPAVIAQQLTVIGASAGAAFFWWTVTVPEKRLEISRSKKGGDIKDYLDDLEDDGERSLERWLLTDWRNPDKRKEPALPFLPKGKFNSGDNPILAAAALILAAGVANAIAERAFFLPPT